VYDLLDVSHFWSTAVVSHLNFLESVYNRHIFRKSNSTNF
jgi:hypothetical protein